MNNKINKAFADIQPKDLLTFKVTRKHLSVLQPLVQQAHCYEAVIRSVIVTKGKLYEQFFVIVGKDEQLMQQYCHILKQLNLCIGKAQRWHVLSQRGVVLALVYDLALACVPLLLHNIMLYTQNSFLGWMFVLPLIALGIQFYFHRQLNLLDNLRLKNTAFCQQQAHVTHFREDDFNGK